MFLKNETEFLLFIQLIDFHQDPLTEFRIIDLLDQIL